MAIEYIRIYSKTCPYPAYLIFKKTFKGFNHFEFHIIGQSAYVMMRFDGGRRSVYRNRFNNIGINCSLCQPADIADIYASWSNTSIKVLPMIFRFCSGSLIHSSIKKKITGINTLDIQTHVL